ncbi:MAG: glycosyltransferase family 1 protein [Terracidiphilus sp.]|jgi:glycosyltransferase involved in cell wall biosynthesis
MKVLIAAVSHATSISGVQRHALNMVRCLLPRQETDEIHFVVAPWQCRMVEAARLPVDHRLQIHIADIDRGSLSRNLWHYRKLPELAKQLNADVVHLSYPVPLNARAFPCPTVVTLHDMYPYEIPMNFGFPKFLFNRAILRQCLRAADAIACVSDATRMRLKQYAPAGVWKKAVRIYNCVESELIAEANSPIPRWKGETFLLCIAQHRRNKNIPLLIRAFDRLLRSEWIDAQSKLIVIGMRGPETASIHRLVRETRRERSVHLLEGLSETELQWCYRNCAALVAPSLTEGFGLPIAEGLLAGCRVVCSNIPAHREIGERSCQFVTLREHPAQALAAAIADTLHEPKPEPIELPQFSAAALAEDYWALYRRLIASAASAWSTGPAIAPGADISITVPESQSALVYRGK